MRNLRILQILRVIRGSLKEYSQTKDPTTRKELFLRLYKYIVDAEKEVEEKYQREEECNAQSDFQL